MASIYIQDERLQSTMNELRIENLLFPYPTNRLASPEFWRIPTIRTHLSSCRTHPGPTIESQCSCLLGNDILGECPNPFLTHNCSLGCKPGQGSLVMATTEYSAHDLPEHLHATLSPAAALRKVS